ncbi:hypothetical protein BDZ97DRAFT_1914462 [Flammula alnicola]|nr:hypothetical protein BDZ97DRAFT_1914462 [Flammula alnicola]
MTNPISNQAMDASLSHHVHSDEELLPGSRGAAPTVDYSPDTIEHATLPPSEVGETQNFQPHEGAHHHTHTHEHFKGHDDATGSRCGEETNLPESKTSTAPVPAYVGPTTEKRDFTINPSFGDKIIGKTEELAGKITHNPELQVKGEVRSQGLAHSEGK